VDASNLKFLHGTSSRGPFIRVSNSGLVSVNTSEITAETIGYVVREGDLCIYSC
jgi:hypothetical protein